MSRYVENIATKNKYKKEFSKYSRIQLQTVRALHEGRRNWHLQRIQEILKEIEEETTSLRIYLLCGQVDELLDCQLVLSAIDILLDEKKKEEGEFIC